VAAGLSEILVTIHQTVQCNDAEYQNFEMAATGCIKKLSDKYRFTFLESRHSITVRAVVH